MSKIFLSTYDNSKIEIDKNYINIETSSFFFNLFDGMDLDNNLEDEIIYLENEHCTLTNLEFIISFWKKFIISPSAEFDKLKNDEKIEHCSNYFKTEARLTKDKLSSIIICFHYLDCELGLNSSCKYMASLIKLEMENNEYNNESITV